MRSAALVLLLVLSSGARAAEPDTYIFDVLALQPYKGSFARLVKGDGAPDWVKAIAVQGAGTAGPSKTVDVAGTPYRLDRVCKVDASCATDRIDVLWAPRGARVWGALMVDGKAPVMLGDSKGAQLKALSGAVGGTPLPTPALSATATAPVTAAAPVTTPPQPSVAASAPMVAAVPGAEPDNYIFDVLAVQPYKGNFARLVRKGTSDWVKAISAQGAGAAGPMRTVDVAGTPYRLDRVCKVGASCADDRIDVLWAPHGAKVWAALVEDGKAPVMLGDPKGSQAAALADAVGAGPAPPVPAATSLPAAPAPGTGSATPPLPPPPLR